MNDAKKKWGDSSASDEEQYEDWLRIYRPQDPILSRASAEFKEGLKYWLQLSMTRDPFG